VNNEIKNHCKELYNLCAKVTGIREVCLRCGYIWASWEESHECLPPVFTFTEDELKNDELEKFAAKYGPKKRS